MHPDEINWNEMWRDKQNNTVLQSETGTPEERWDRLAPCFALWSEHDEYPSKLLQRVQITHEWSVLDIGCGTGVITIPAAIRGSRVTALDVSPRMLEFLKNDADKRYLGNIRYLLRSWESIRIGTDIKPHDVVITSRTIARTGDLLKSLMKIDQAALRYAYVTAWGGERGEFIRGLRNALDRNNHDSPEDIYIFNILHQMGIHPNVEQLECRNNVQYQNIEQACTCYQVLFDLTPEETVIAQTYLEKNLVPRKDGKFEEPDTQTLWSLIWWKK